MSQRNPMNERYTREEHTGVTRKSAASAKPKSKAAASVTIQSSNQKTPKEKKAARKEEQRKLQDKQRELDRKYYTPNTEKYKQLRRKWWIALGLAILMVVISWFARSLEPYWISFVALILAYVFIIYAFYIDFSKIRKERTAYQQRMAKQELEAEKKRKKANKGKTPQNEIASSEPEKKTGFFSGLFNKKNNPEKAEAENK